MVVRRHARRRFIAAPLVVVLAAAVGGCKETGQSHQGDGTGAGEAGDGDGVVAGRNAPQKGFYASDVQYLQKDSEFFFQVWNDTFTRKLEDLPMSGEVPDDHKPYSGGYYAEGDGGTDQVMVGGKSPLAKYDDAFYAGDARAVQWERDKHTSGPEWAGHCNGFSAASSRHNKEPSKSVVRNGVTFAPQDIKALLAEVYMSADYQFLGGNRCDNPTLAYPNGRTDPTVRDDCEGVNPGTLHAAVANWIGRMHHNIILDAYPNEQVWNYPLFKYQVLSKDYISAQQAAGYVDGGSTYKFNPAAVKFALVHVKLTYAEALRKEVLNQFYTKDMDLTYVLEVDANGDIIGGEWASGETQKFHPGFIWVALEPQAPNGTRYMGNQYIDAGETIKMWAESVGLDPAHPPTDLKRPAGTSDWGRWASFDAILDGQRTGADFAGKQVQLHVVRHQGLDGAGVTLDLTLNNTALKTITTSGSEQVNLAFDAGIGLNILDFSWKKDGAVVEDEVLRFRVVR